MRALDGRVSAIMSMEKRLLSCRMYKMRERECNCNGIECVQNEFCNCANEWMRASSPNPKYAFYALSTLELDTIEAILSDAIHFIIIIIAQIAKCSLVLHGRRIWNENYRLPQH